jgi:tetratricopeptide (TPR) repeat protein
VLKGIVADPQSLDLATLIAALNKSLPFPKISEKSCQEVAKLDNSKQANESTHWHTGLGLLLWEAKRIEAANVEFTEAEKKDEGAWKPKEMIARYQARRSEYKKAIQKLDGAIKALPKNLNWLRAPPWFEASIVLWKLAMNDSEGALKITKKALASMDKSKYRLTDIYYHIDALYKGRHYVELVEFLKELDEPNSNVTGSSVLVKFLSAGFAYDVFDEIGAAISAIPPGECTQFLQAAVDAALVNVADNQDPWARCKIALFSARYRNQTEMAIRVWESTLQQAEETRINSKSRFGNGYKLASDELSQLYFNGAIRTAKDSREREQWVSKLKNLSTESQNGNIRYRKNNASLLLGRFLRFYEGVKDAEWRCPFRPKVLEGIDMLTDEDLENDQQAYADLGLTLLLAGEEQDAGAALAVTMLPLISRSKASEVHQGQEVGFVLWWRCDGQCNTDISKYKELHFCRSCINTCFCESCIKLVGLGQLPISKCSSAHTHYKAYPVPEDLEPEAAKVDKNRHQLWLDNLRQNWEV